MVHLAASPMKYHGLAALFRVPEPLSNPLPASPRRPGADVHPHLSLDEDRSLLERVRNRDQSAMAQIFDRYSGMAYAIALRVLNDSGQAEDVIQDVFFQVWQNPKVFVPERGSLGAWLAVVIRNRSVDVLRRRRPSEPVENLVLADSTDFASGVEREAILDQVRSVLKGLPAEQRESLELAYFGGLTHAEIARQRGEPLGTVKSRIRMALITLRKVLEA